MVVPPKHPKMIIFSRQNPWLLGTTILGNPHIPNQRKEAINKGRNRKKKIFYTWENEGFELEKMVAGNENQWLSGFSFRVDIFQGFPGVVQPGGTWVFPTTQMGKKVNELCQWRWSWKNAS